MPIRKLSILGTFVGIVGCAYGVVLPAGVTFAVAADPSAVSMEAEADSPGRGEDARRWHRQSALPAEDARPAQVFGVSQRPGTTETFRVSSVLDLVLKQARPEETVPVLVYFRDRGLPAPDRDRIRALPRSLRRGEGTRELRRRADRSQAPVLQLLRRLEAAGEAAGIRRLWLVNAVAVELPAARVYDLLRFPEVRAIDWDPILDLSDVFDDEAAPAAPADPPGSSGGYTRGDGLDPTVFSELYRVRAPECWALGYDGTGVLVAVIDEGFDYTHPDVFDRLYINPGEIAENGIDDDDNGFIDDVHGWDFVNGDNDPLILSGNDHGTNVLGLVAGDGTNGFLTGVAKGVTFLPIAAVSASFNASTWFAGFDYAALMGADVVVMSATQKWTPSPLKPAYDAWRELMENELTLGIVQANSAGNRGLVSYESPVPFNIGAPANCPSPWQGPYDYHVGGRTSVVAVGALLDSNLARDNSSRGPSTWEDIAQTWPVYTDSIRVQYQDYPWTAGEGGLLKPDLCAPGTELQTLDLGGGYVSRTGTSFSTPYVGGAVAILLQARPSLTPEEIDEALQMSAQDLGEFGKDNVYGAGMLDCYDALQYVLNLDSQSYIDGVVRSAASLDSLGGARITLLAPHTEYRANERGGLRFPAKPGLKTLVIERYGYYPDTLFFSLPNGAVYNFTADLDTVSTGHIVGTVLGQDQLPVEGAVIQIVGTPQMATTGADGTYRFDDVPGGDLLYLEALRFNYAASTDTLTLVPGLTDTLDFDLAIGLFDDFERDQGWTVGAPGDDALRGVWERSDPHGTYAGAVPVQPEDDFSPQGSDCYHTENCYPGAGPIVSEVSRGRTTLTSPIFDGTLYDDPQLVYARWLSNDTDGDPSNDANSLRVLLSSNGGVNWTQVEAPGTSSGAWHEVSVPIANFVTVSDSMRIQLVATDLTTSGVVEAAIDDIRISEDTSGIDDTDRTQTGPRLVLALQPGRPNPFRDGTTLRFQVPSADDVRLDVFDVQGRRVRELVSTRLDAGSHTVDWDGRDDRGNSLASGLYFYRLAQGGESVIGRALRMR